MMAISSYHIVMFWDHYIEDCMEQLQDQVLKLIILEMEEMYSTLIFVMTMVSQNLIKLRCIYVIGAGKTGLIFT